VRADRHHDVLVTDTAVATSAHPALASGEAAETGLRTGTTAACGGSHQSMRRRIRPRRTRPFWLRRNKARDRKCPERRILGFKPAFELEEPGNRLKARRTRAVIAPATRCFSRRLNVDDEIVATHNSAAVSTHSARRSCELVVERWDVSDALLRAFKSS
jgi:hypothetical protein